MYLASKGQIALTWTIPNTCYPCWLPSLFLYWTF